MSSQVPDLLRVFDVLNLYGEAADRRDWALYERVFTPDATADYGGMKLEGRDAIVGLIRNSLGGCGPTQHLLGNHAGGVDGDDAHATCKVRAFHKGAGERSGATYELFGTYHHDLIRTTDGWRTRHLRMDIALEVGTRSVLRPA